MGLKAPFDSSSERITVTAAKKSESPGPQDYYPKPQPECKCENQGKIFNSRRNSDSRTPAEHEV